MVNKNDNSLLALSKSADDKCEYLQNSKKIIFRFQMLIPITKDRKYISNSENKKNNVLPSLKSFTHPPKITKQHYY